MQICTIAAMVAVPAAVELGLFILLARAVDIWMHRPDEGRGA